MLASWVLVAGLLWWRVDEVSDTAEAVTLLRCLALLLVLGALFALDDEAYNLAAPASVPLATRTVTRLLVATTSCTVAWLPALVLTAARPGVAVPPAITLDLAALLGCGLAAAAAAQRYFNLTEPGLAAGPIMIGLVGGLLVLPQRWAFVVPPGDEWRAAHQRWAGLLAVAALLMVASLRDPATRPPRRHTALPEGTDWPVP